MTEENFTVGVVMMASVCAFQVNRMMAVVDSFPLKWLYHGFDR